jgi:ABC-type transport system involved in multi-copper enzyme maturation permease subunit
MYAWKCWRETRARFFACLILILVSIGFVDGSTMVSEYRAGHIASKGTFNWIGNMYAEEHIFLIPITLAIVGGITFACACLLGATASGGEIEAGTAEYLWTRPRRRKAMSWTHWGVCVAELGALVFITTALQTAFLAIVADGSEARALLLATPVFVFAALPILGIVVLMTAVRRSANGGLIFGGGIVLGYVFCAVMLEIFWQVRTPGLSSALAEWLAHFAVSPASATVAFPWGVALRVGLLAAAFPVAAQYVLKRTEI